MPRWLRLRMGGWRSAPADQLGGNSGVWGCWRLERAPAAASRCVVCCPTRALSQACHRVVVAIERVAGEGEACGG
jgi:hypothetical protein